MAEILPGFGLFSAEMGRLLRPGTPSQEYVRARLAQFAGAFAGRINPQLSLHVVQQVATECIASLPAPEYGRLPVEQRDLQLVFRHDCLWGPTAEALRWVCLWFGA